MNCTYCYSECEKGKVIAKKFILDCESVFDAAFDFNSFVKECFKTCQYKQFHKETKDDN